MRHRRFEALNLVGGVAVVALLAAVGVGVVAAAAELHGRRFAAGGITGKTRGCEYGYK